MVESLKTTDEQETLLGKRTHAQATDQNNEVGIDEIMTDDKTAVTDANETDANNVVVTNPNLQEYNASGQRVTQKTLRGFVSTKDGKPLLLSNRGGKHPKSLWRDEQLFPSMLESHQNIFDIIMPWVAEKKEEEKKLKAASSANSGKRSTATQKSLSSFFKPKTPARQAKA